MDSKRSQPLGIELVRKGIVSEDSKIASLSLQEVLGAGREASVFVERERVLWSGGGRVS